MPHTRDAILDPNDPVSPLSAPASQTAVLFLDYHNFIFDRVPAGAAPTVIAATKKLRVWAESNNALIIHGLLDVKGPIIPTYKGLKRIIGMQQTLLSNPDSASIIAEHPEIAPKGIAASEEKDVQKISENEYVVKRMMGKLNALKSYGLMELLEERGIKSLVISGLSTSGCVAATARPAGDEGFLVTIIEDACADPKEGVHDIVLEDVVSSQAHVCTADEWVKAWDTKGGN